MSYYKRFTEGATVKLDNEHQCNQQQLEMFIGNIFINIERLRALHDSLHKHSTGMCRDCNELEKEYDLINDEALIKEYNLQKGIIHDALTRNISQFMEDTRLEE